jgi:hypothetical protein
MNTVVAQVWFFRDIQKAFRKGVDPDLMTAILLKFLFVAIPLITVFVVWRHWERIRFFLVRAWNIRKHDQVRLRIAQHLKQRKMRLEVFLVGKKAQQFLGQVAVVKIGRRRLLLEFLTDVPNALSRVVAHKRIICYGRPFKVAGKRVNSFHTYVIRTAPGVAGIRSMLVYTPAQYVNTPRRTSSRKRLARPGVVRFRLWGQAKREKFIVLAPDFETSEQHNEKTAWKEANRVVNISAGGLKLQVFPRRPGDVPRSSEPVVLDLHVLNPDKTSFSNLLLQGVVRNVARPSSGAVFLGIQFVGRGVRTGSRAVEWQPVRGDLPELERLLG